MSLVRRSWVGHRRDCRHILPCPRLDSSPRMIKVTHTTHTYACGTRASSSQSATRPLCQSACRPVSHGQHSRASAPFTRFCPPIFHDSHLLVSCFISWSCDITISMSSFFIASRWWCMGFEVQIYLLGRGSPQGNIASLVITFAYRSCRQSSVIIHLSSVT